MHNWGGNVIYWELRKRWKIDQTIKWYMHNRELVLENSLVWFYSVSTIVGYLMPKTFLYISTILFQTFQLSINIQFSSIWIIRRILSGATTPGQNGPGNDSNKEILRIPQRSGITGSSPLFNVISCTLVGGVLSLCRDSVVVFCSPNWLGHMKNETHKIPYDIKKRTDNSIPARWPESDYYQEKKQTCNQVYNWGTIKESEQIKQLLVSCQTAKKTEEPESGTDNVTWSTTERREKKNVP